MFDPLYKWRWKPIHNQFRFIALILIVPWKPLYKTEENNRCIADGIKVVESPWWIPSIDKQIQRIIYVFEFHFKRNETFFLLHSPLLPFWTILIIELQSKLQSLYFERTIRYQMQYSKNLSSNRSSTPGTG